MPSEIQSRAPEIRDRASKCETVLDLARAMSWNMETARHCNTELGLGLAEKALRPASAPHAGVACPKPVKKGAK